LCEGSIVEVYNELSKEAYSKVDIDEVNAVIYEILSAIGDQ
jgi:hypothetical protein